MKKPYRLTALCASIIFVFLLSFNNLKAQSQFEFQRAVTSNCAIKIEGDIGGTNVNISVAGSSSNCVWSHYRFGCFIDWPCLVSQADMTAALLNVIRK